MPSSELVSFESHLKNLKADLIVVGKFYNQYSREDHRKALAFVLLASAALEGAVEKRCENAAKAAAERLRKSQPSRTGRALIMAHLVKERSFLPVKDEDLDAPLEADIAAALASYRQRLKNNHGLTGYDLRKVLIPLGLKEAEVPQVLLNRLEAIGELRNPAAHVLVNQRKSQVEPVSQYEKFAELLPDLRAVDAALTVAVESF